MAGKAHAAAGALLSALVLVPGGARAQQQTLTMAVGAPVTSLDPHYHQLSPNNAAASMIFDRLVNTDHQSRMVPGLATEWRAVEPTVWEFKLRPGVRFHNGQEFTAEDVAFTIARVPNVPNSPSSFAIYTRPIREVQVVDPLTIRFRTETPYPLLPMDMSNLFILDRQTHEGAATEDFNGGRAAVGTGPFRVVSHRNGDRIEFERNDAYWGDRPAFARVNYRMITNDAARTAALLAGRVDWIESPAPDSLDKLKAGGCKIETNAIPHMWPYTLSMVPGAPTADIRVRKALNLAIDRDAMVKLLGGLAVPAVGCVPPDHPWFGAPSFKIKYDPAEARKLMAEAGYGPAKRLKIKVAISTAGSGQMYPLIMNEFIQQQYAEIGVDLEFQVMDWNALINLTRQGAKSPEGAQLAAINSSWNTMDPHNAFTRFVDSQMVPPKGSNWGYINDAELDALAAEARRTSDVEMLDKVLARINTRMVDQALFVWVVHDVWPNAISGKVKGYVHPKSWYVDFSPVTVG